MAPENLPLGELLARFLTRRAADCAAGIPEVPLNEVEPYEAAAFPMVEPRTAWNEAINALQLLDTEGGAIRVTPPADWAGMVTASVSFAAVPFAGGNFPQLVRDLPALVRTSRRSDLRPQAQSTAPAPSLENWGSQAIRKRLFPDALLAIGLLRLAQQTEAAARMLEELRPHVPARWKVAYANEEAALAWHAGEADKALALWSGMADSAPVLFNRGMALLFSDRPTEARAALSAAAALLSEDNAWHQLARLYLALTQI